MFSRQLAAGHQSSSESVVKLRAVIVFAIKSCLAVVFVLRVSLVNSASYIRVRSEVGATFGVWDRG